MALVFNVRIEVVELLGKGSGDLVSVWIIGVSFIVDEATE